MIYRNIPCGCGSDCCKPLQGNGAATPGGGFDLIGGIGSIFSGLFAPGQGGPTAAGCTISCNLSFLSDSAARQACLNNCLSQVGGGNNQQFIPGMGQGIDLTTIALLGIGGFLIYKLVKK